MHTLELVEESVTEKSEIVEEFNWPLEQIDEDDSDQIEDATKATEEAQSVLNSVNENEEHPTALLTHPKVETSAWGGYAFPVNRLIPEESNSRKISECSKVVSDKMVEKTTKANKEAEKVMFDVDHDRGDIQNEHKSLKPTEISYTTTREKEEMTKHETEASVKTESAALGEFAWPEEGLKPIESFGSLSDFDEKQMIETATKAIKEAESVIYKVEHEDFEDNNKITGQNRESSETVKKIKEMGTESKTNTESSILGGFAWLENGLQEFNEEEESDPMVEIATKAVEEAKEAMFKVEHENMLDFQNNEFTMETLPTLTTKKTSEKIFEEVSTESINIEEVSHQNENQVKVVETEIYSEIFLEALLHKKVKKNIKQKL